MKIKKEPPDRNSQNPNKVSKKPSKRDQIISLFITGISGVEEISRIIGTKPSYVASVLQREGLISGYFDLYTSTTQAINMYSRFFSRKLGFKDKETASQSLSLIDRLYHQFETIGDRAGQHHALMMALTMFNRARWTNKKREAEVFREWLVNRLEEEVYDSDKDDSKLSDVF